MEKPNILILVLDALRTQNMSLYGYNKKTTPNLEKISKEATLYKNTIASSYWTLPSTASLFTGTYTSTHYLIKNGDKLSQKFVTLPEYLNKKGYDCYGLSPNPFVSKYSKLDRGFHIFDDFYENSIKHKINSLTNNFFEGNSGENKNQVANTLFNKISKNYAYKKLYWYFTGFFDKFATSINNKIEYYLKNRDRNKPFFLYAHYTETHTPYVIPRKYREKFFENTDLKPWDINQDHFDYYINDSTITQEQFSTLRSIYDGAINYLDNKVFEIYDFLENNNLIDNTMLIITSDHGDQLGEKGLFFHVFSLYDTLIKIPLIIKYNENYDTKKIEEKLAQNTDIFPTIAYMLKDDEIELNKQFQGNNLLNDENEKRGNYAISELYKPFGPRLIKSRDKLKKYDKKLLAIRNDNKKYIFSSNGMNELYEIKNDVFEERNIYEKSYNPLEDFKKEEIFDWINTFKMVSKYDKSINKIQEEIYSRIK
jgi:arylsulfatase A-like enzyme